MNTLLIAPPATLTTQEGVQLEPNGHRPEVALGSVEISHVSFPFDAFVEHNIKVVATLFRDNYAVYRQKKEKKFVLQGPMAGLSYWEPLARQFLKTEKLFLPTLMNALDRCDLYPWASSLLSPGFNDYHWGCIQGFAVDQPLIQDCLQGISQLLAIGYSSQRILNEQSKVKFTRLAPLLWCAAMHLNVHKWRMKLRQKTVWAFLHQKEGRDLYWQQFRNELQLLLPPHMRSAVVPPEQSFGWQLEHCQTAPLKQSLSPPLERHPEPQTAEMPPVRVPSTEPTSVESPPAGLLSPDTPIGRYLLGITKLP